MAQVGNSKRWIGLGNDDDGLVPASSQAPMLFGLAVRSGSFDGRMGDCLAGLGWWMVEVVEKLAAATTTSTPPPTLLSLRY